MMDYSILEILCAYFWQAVLVVIMFTLMFALPNTNSCLSFWKAEGVIILLALFWPVTFMVAIFAFLLVLPYILFKYFSGNIEAKPLKEALKELNPVANVLRIHSLCKVKK